jgi:putative peptidoglycan lipid II flippase
VLGMAIATVIYPALARHAARGDRRQVGVDLTAGLRLVWFTALPAGIGIMLLAEPIVNLLFVRGAFTEHDGQRAAVMVACYASAAWAFCALPVLVRGFYAIGNRQTPLRIGMLTVGLDLVITLALIWPLAERGLAISTALSASVQVVLLTALFSRVGSPLLWPELRATLAKGTVATLAMVLAVVICGQIVVPADASSAQASANLLLAISVGAATYLLAAWALGMSELAMLARRRRAGRDAPPQAMISRIG